MKISIDDLLKHSVIITCYQKQLEYCLAHFKHIFGKIADNILSIEGFGFCDSKRYGTFTDKQRNCTFSHLYALRLCRLFNWPYICIFEEDAWFNDLSLELFQEHLNNIPNDCSTIALGLNKQSKCYQKYKDNIINDYFIKSKDIIENIDKERNTTLFTGAHAYVCINADINSKNGLENREFILRKTGVADNLSFNVDQNFCASTISFFCQNNTDEHVDNTIYKTKI